MSVRLYENGELKEVANVGGFPLTRDKTISSPNSYAIDAVENNPDVDGTLANSVKAMEAGNAGRDEEIAKLKALAEEQKAVISALSGLVDNRNTYRGKFLGNAVMEEQIAAVRAGTFEDLYIGDYWTIDGVDWMIADMDYWYNCGDTAFIKHHLVIIPRVSLYNAQMNTADTTDGGYVGSTMYTTNLTEAKTKITKAFWDLVLTHKEYLVNAVANGKPSAGAWENSSVELPNECMMYGHPHFAPACDGSTVPALYTIGKTQLALFRLRPELIVDRTYNQWLRDVVSSADFASVGDRGIAYSHGASYSIGVRPVFPIG